jgi:hypothetical protein
MVRLHRTAARAVAQDHLPQAPLGRRVQGIKAVGRLQQRGQRARGLLGLACHQAQGVLAVKARAPDQGQQFVVRLRHASQQHRAMRAQVARQTVQGFVRGGHGAAPRQPWRPIQPRRRWSPAHAVLQDVFGYEQFRGPQQAIVEHVIGGGDALVLMPTGGGKSLCYQVPAIVRQRQGAGVTIVVSPLIALMHDQVGALHEAGVDAAFLNSTLTLTRRRTWSWRLQTGEITLLYAAPERLNTPRFLGLLDSLYQRATCRCSPLTKRIA